MSEWLIVSLVLPEWFTKACSGFVDLVVFVFSSSDTLFDLIFFRFVHQFYNLPFPFAHYPTIIILWAFAQGKRKINFFKVQKCKAPIGACRFNFPPPIWKMMTDRPTARPIKQLTDRTTDRPFDHQTDRPGFRESYISNGHTITTFQFICKQVDIGATMKPTCVQVRQTKNNRPEL